MTYRECLERDLCKNMELGNQLMTSWESEDDNFAKKVEFCTQRINYLLAKSKELSGKELDDLLADLNEEEAIYEDVVALHNMEVKEIQQAIEACKRDIVLILDELWRSKMT